MNKLLLPGLLLSFTLAAAAPAPDLAAAIGAGKVGFTARLRWENADQAGLAGSDAVTLRTALGYTTASWRGLQAGLELENIAVLNDDNDYNAAGTNPGGAGRTVIADPAGTDINQAWLGLTEPGFTLKSGRQRLVLDNARFVGDSGWRQNQQTFDAATVTASPRRDVALFYGYGWRVSRVYGNRAPQPDFKGDLHLLNASYSGWKPGKFTAYAYLLDFDNSPANSSRTFGASFAGAAPLAGGFKLSYRAEYAVQEDAGLNPVSYRADYRLLEVRGAIKPVEFGAGWEVLGSDGGRKGFSTPLATLHAFNGWADLFAATPARGLRDLYLSAAVALPGGFPLKAVWHDFRADQDGAKFGREWNILLSHPLGKHVALAAKWAEFDGRPPYADTTRFWLQCEFTL